MSLFLRLSGFTFLICSGCMSITPGMEKKVYTSSQERAGCYQQLRQNQCQGSSHLVERFYFKFDDNSLVEMELCCE